MQRNELLRAMEAIDFRALTSGALVGIRELRRMFPSLDKATFDSEVRRLVRESNLDGSYMLCLHFHDYPSSLTQEERDELLYCPADTWNRERYMVGIAVRNTQLANARREVK